MEGVAQEGRGGAVGMRRRRRWYMAGTVAGDAVGRIVTGCLEVDLQLEMCSTCRTPSLDHAHVIAPLM